MDLEKFLWHVNNGYKKRKFCTPNCWIIWNSSQRFVRSRNCKCFFIGHIPFNFLRNPSYHWSKKRHIWTCTFIQCDDSYPHIRSLELCAYILSLWFHQICISEIQKRLLIHSKQCYLPVTDDDWTVESATRIENNIV